jgi:hypothetical protein
MRTGQNLSILGRYRSRVVWDVESRSIGPYTVLVVPHIIVKNVGLSESATRTEKGNGGTGD